MAYNNYFPQTYQMPAYYPQQAQPQPPQQTQTQSLIWVQGEAGAKSYLVAPNSTVTLWDSEQSVIYIKSADASGMPSIKTLDYKIRGNSPQERAEPIGDEFAKKEDVSKEIKRLEKMIKDLGKG